VLDPVEIDCGFIFSSYSFEIDGETIPHIVRSSVDSEIRAYIYVRPRVEETIITVVTE